MTSTPPPLKHSALNRTLWFLGGYAFFLISTISLAVYYIADHLETINQSVLEFDELSREVETVNEYFIRQAKDRKNLFLRGQNPNDLDKYLGRVNTLTQKIQNKTHQILGNPLADPYQDSLEQFLRDHAQLMEVYRQGIEIFHDTQDHTAGDQFVRGEGGEVGAELTHVLRQIQSDRQSLLQTSKRHIRNFLIISTSSLIITILICSAWLAIVVTAPIRRIVRFTNFLEASCQQRQTISFSSERSEDLRDTNSLDTNSLDTRQVPSNQYQGYQPAEGQQPDEIGYMIDAYSKLSTLIGDYHQTLEQTVEYRTAELRLAKEQADSANRAKSEFLANMSHELRTPLNGVLGYAQILSFSPDLDDKEKQGIEVIHQCGSHLLTLINDILDLAKIEARRLELVPSFIDLKAFLWGVVEICEIRAAAKNLSFIYQPSSELPQSIEADETRLRQVLLNLLSNAIKFTTEGSVTFKVDVSQQTVTCMSLLFRVIDTGVGIAAHDIPKLFQAFGRVGDDSSQTEGTGLGLVISQQIVQLMGGDIQVKSEFGQGSEFSFAIDIPAGEKAIDAPPLFGSGDRVIGYAIAEETLPSSHQYTILVVDDQWENRAVLKDLLEPLGFIVLEAGDGEQGLAILESNAPDIIIADLVMPIMDGFEFLHCIRHSDQLQHHKIIVSSASVSQEDQYLALEHGGDSFLPKPVDAHRLFQLLSNYLNIRWIYSSGTQDSVALSAQQLNTIDILLPSPSILKTFLQLAQHGHLQGLQQNIEHLATTDARYRPFANSILPLAKQFQIEAIEALLQEYLR